MQLVLDKYGISLSVDNGMFKVSHKEGSRTVPVNKVKSIILQQSATVSTNALMEAIENEIDISLLNRLGHPVGKIWSYKYGSISTIRKNQLAFATSRTGKEWVRDIILNKLDNHAALIITLGEPMDELEGMREKSIQSTEKYKGKMAQLTFSDIKKDEDKLRAWEGQSSKVYFKCISEHLPGQYKFSGRSQHPATDMFNCLLNYAYGILYSKVEAALMQAGIDPYTGILHRDEYNKPVMVYDVIETFRIWADFTVTDLCMQEVIFREFFDIEGQVFYLNSTGKKVLIHHFNDYMEEVIPRKGNQRSRNEHVKAFAGALAQKLKTL